MRLPEGLWEIDRYFLGDQEVTKERWIRAERAAGFRPKGQDRGQPATGGFSSGEIRGHQQTFYTSPVDEGTRVDECVNCGRWLVCVLEATYSEPTQVTTYRHWSDAFEHNVGPRECDRPPVRLMAEPAKVTAE